MKNAVFSSVVLAILILISFAVVLADTRCGPTPVKTIRIIQHPGYFETKSNIFNIQPGRYEFLVENQSRKDAGFILSKKGRRLTEVFIKEGDSARTQVNLNGGFYNYYCPLIPTASYPLRVR